MKHPIIRFYESRCIPLYPRVVRLGRRPVALMKMARVPMCAHYRPVPYYLLLFP